MNKQEFQEFLQVQKTTADFRYAATTGAITTTGSGDPNASDTWSQQTQ